jgi:hypothetical protein
MPICFFTSISIVLLAIAYFFLQRKKSTIKGGQFAGMSDKNTLTQRGQLSGMGGQLISEYTAGTGAVAV